MLDWLKKTTLIAHILKGHQTQLRQTEEIASIMSFSESRRNRTASSRPTPKSCLFWMLTSPKVRYLITLVSGAEFQSKNNRPTDSHSLFLAGELQSRFFEQRTELQRTAWSFACGSILRNGRGLRHNNQFKVTE